MSEKENLPRLEAARMIGFTGGYEIKRIGCGTFLTCAVESWDLPSPPQSSGP
jgi:hypothetical protein